MDATVRIAFIDYDNDGFVDIIAENSLWKHVVATDGSHDFVIDTTGNSFQGGVYDGDISAFGDFDGNGFIDVVISGSSGYTLHRNIGGTFEAVAGVTFPGTSTDVRAGDFDNVRNLPLVQRTALLRNPPSHSQPLEHLFVRCVCGAGRAARRARGH